MKNLFLLPALLLLTPVLIPAQVPKEAEGAKPLRPLLGNVTTRAVVIGISDYQNIPDLNYAHRDADAFAEWLRSPAGGSLPADNIRLLLNEQATEGHITAQLWWLLQESGEGDKVIIFFSGHGDIEIKLLSLGYLLCWDAPPFGYLTGGCVEVDDLQKVVNALTLLNKSKVLLITDACRSGKLAGSESNGPGITTANLHQHFENAIKILSCQANEISIEGIQWGGGHGAFSYHLIDGLYGLADQNEDMVVNVQETRRYLEDKVTPEVAPINQTPVIVGSNANKLANVDSAILARVKTRKTNELFQFSPGDTRGLEDQILAGVDSSIQQTYTDFLAAAERKDLMYIANDSKRTADSCFEILIQDTSIQELHGHIKRKYVAALMEEGQQYINAWLKSEKGMVGLTNPFISDQIAKAAAILGKSHYLYNDLKAKECFFKAHHYSISADSFAIANFDSLLQLAYTYNDRLPVLYALEAGRARTLLKDYYKAEKLHRKAIELVPGWAFEYNYLGDCYFALGDMDRAKTSWEKAIELKQDYYIVYKGLFQLYQRTGNYFEAQNLSKSIAQIPQDSLDNLNNLDYLYFILNEDHRFEEAKRICGKMIETMEASHFYDDNLFMKGNYYWWCGDLDKAEFYFKKYINQVLNSGKENLIKNLAGGYGPYAQLGCVKMTQGDWREAERMWFINDSLQGTTPGYSTNCWSAFTQGKLDAANRLLKEELKNRGDKINVDAAIGDVLFLISIYNLIDYSIFWLEKTSEFVPDHQQLRYHLARLYLEQKSDYKNAIRHLKKAVQLAPESPYFYYLLGVAYAQTGKTKRALLHLEKAQEKGYSDYQGIAKDRYWDSMRDTKGFQRLIRRYSPKEQNK